MTNDIEMQNELACLDERIAICHDAIKSAIRIARAGGWISRTEVFFVKLRLAHYIAAKHRIESGGKS